ncbi:hypothetical protein K2173_021337 [Erythroxylum novogranatense]|uniref:Uncharacterized protein n=1 Tax=Erythroxylum novogranatense TaxID=1862640 RepID=A0AAV8TWZ1_9ROSI|nr:hypothetical protein K2173_021337 [Erythroxylum novogranatense]
MQDMFIVRRRSRRRSEDMTNLHHYRVELFYSVIDMQLQELNNRFDEFNTSLLLCMTCLDPKDSFSTFDKDKLIELAKFYPSDGIGDLAKRMVATRKHHVFPLVYLLVKLSLLLPVATATVERDIFLNLDKGFKFVLYDMLYIMSFRRDLIFAFVLDK